MKRIFRLFAIFLIISLLLSSNAFASASGIDNPNAEQDALVAQIDLLFNERRQIVFSDYPDLERLDEIDIALCNLGVDFHTEEEAAQLFPDAVTSVDLSPDSTSIGNENIAMPAFDIDGWTNSKNLWTSYRVSDYYCEDEWLNIQRVQVQPLSEESSLWEEDATYVDFTDSPAFVATSNILDLTVSTALGYIHPVAPTIYDLLSRGIELAVATFEVDLNDIEYRWECATTVVFSYVRYENQTDYDQLLTLVTSKCDVAVACIMDIEEIRYLENGMTAPNPALIAEDYEITTQSHNHNSNGRAGFLFLRATSLEPSLEYITQIKATAPGATEEFYIFPSTPRFPLQVT